MLHEVGTTNRTHLSDYERAINPESTGALLKVHTSNYRIDGFTKEVSIEELVEIGQRHGMPVIYDLGSGALLPLSRFGIYEEPCITDCVRSGADIVCFSGDKLLRGAQAGIILGSKRYISEMKKNPLTRAVRIDKLTLAALEATLKLYADADTASREIPIYAMLSLSQEELRKTAKQLISLIGDCEADVTVADTQGRMGGGSLPANELPGAAVEIYPYNKTVTELEIHLRGCEPPIISRISHDRLLIEMRTVDEIDFEYVAGCLKNGLGGKAE